MFFLLFVQTCCFLSVLWFFLFALVSFFYFCFIWVVVFCLLFHCFSVLQDHYYFLTLCLFCILYVCNSLYPCLFDHVYIRMGLYLSYLFYSFFLFILFPLFICLDVCFPFFISPQTLSQFRTPWNLSLDFAPFCFKIGTDFFSRQPKCWTKMLNQNVEPKRWTKVFQEKLQHPSTRHK